MIVSELRRLANHLIFADEAMRLMDALRDGRLLLKTAEDGACSLEIRTKSSAEAKAIYETVMSMAPHNVLVPFAKVSEPILRDECMSLPPNRCALQNEDAQIDRKTFGAPNAFRCKGCGHDFNTAEETPQ